MRAHPSKGEIAPVPGKGAGIGFRAAARHFCHSHSCRSEVTLKTLTKYVLRSHLGPFAFAFVALTGVIFINTVAREMADLAGKGLPPAVIAEFFVLYLPANVALTLPMSVLVAVLYTFSQLAAENEVTALKASGVDLRRVVAPLLLVAALLAAGMVWFNDRVLPEANRRLSLLMLDVAQTSPLLALREQTLNPIQGADGLSLYYLQAGQIDAGSGRMREVVIFDVSTPNVSRTIYADSGTMAQNRTRTDLLLTLLDGQIREVDFSQPDAFQQMDFRQQVLRMQGVSQRLERSTESGYRGDRDMTIAMMRARIDSLEAQAARLERRAGEPLPASAGSPDSRDAQLEPLRRQIREYRVEVQKKYAIAVASLVFVLLGVPLALRFSRGGVGMVIAASFTIFGIYYMGLRGGEALGDRGFVSPVSAMWATNLAGGFLGLWGVFRLGWETGSGRAGAWESLTASRGLRRLRRLRGPGRP